MHKEILSQNQIKLLPLIAEFSKQYYLFRFSGSSGSAIIDNAVD